MESGIKMLMEAYNIGIPEDMHPLCQPKQSYLGLFAMVVLLAAIVLFVVSFVVKDEKKKSLVRKGALAGLITAIIAIALYLAAPYITSTLLGPPPVDQYGCPI